jgi:alpha-N-acetylglucosaminidase
MEQIILYAIDQFIEMEPANGDTLYLKNMSQTIIGSLLEGDPEGKMVMQTWPMSWFQKDFWTRERTKAYFDGIPDDRMIALELMGESWNQTAWYKHDGWYNKPWVWSVISSFGDKVSMFGGLTQISENFGKVLDNPMKGNLAGMGLMNEGLDYNPVVYDFVTDMMWEKELIDLELWKKNYPKRRYGKVNDEISSAWDSIFDHYYTKYTFFEPNPILTDRKKPNLIENDIWPSEASVFAAKTLIAVSDELENIDTYQFDIVNLFRQVFSQYAGHLLHKITLSYHGKNIEEFDKTVKEFIELSKDIEKLLATREEFLLGKWIEDSKKHATNDYEKELYEFNAKKIITTWGDSQRLYGYAIKDWAGMYSSYYLPRWEQFFIVLRNEITGGEKLDYERFVKNIIEWEYNWATLTEENNISSPQGNSILITKELWNKYGNKIISR